jgi:hypothetical protein
MMRSMKIPILFALSFTTTAYPLHAATAIDPVAASVDPTLSVVDLTPAGADQTPATPPQVNPTPTPEAPSAPPAKDEFHGQISGGVQLQTGVTEAWGGTFDGKVTRILSDGWTFIARANYTYATVVVQEDPLVDKVQKDRLSAGAGFDRTFGTKGVAMFRTLYLRDPLHQIHYRTEQIGGVGIRVSDQAKRVEFTFVPGLSLIKEDTFLTGSEGVLGGAGFYQALTLKLDKTWSFDDSFSYRHDFRENDYSIEAYLTLSAMLTKIIGLQIEYQYIKESLVAHGTKPFQSILQVGLQLKF